EPKNQDGHERPLDRAADLLEYRPAFCRDRAADLQRCRLKPALSVCLRRKIEKLTLNGLNSGAAPNHVGCHIRFFVWPLYFSSRELLAEAVNRPRTRAASVATMAIATLMTSLASGLKWPSGKIVPRSIPNNAPPNTHANTRQPSFNVR